MTPIVVWHILFSPVAPLAEDTSTVLDSSQWASAPLKFRNGQIRGAAMMLVSKPWTNQRGERQCYFNKSMDALHLNWYPNNRYPIILQHPNGWTNQEIQDIKSQWPGLEIYFSKVGSAFHIKPPELMEDGEKPLSPLGYKKMCAFKTFGFLQAPYIRTNEIDYMFYIDDDACLTEPIQFDVFQRMKQHQVAYAYKQLFLDRGYVVNGLSDFVVSYVQKHKLKYANPTLRNWLVDNDFQKKAVGSHWTFSTNLEWIDLKHYRNPNVMRFHQAIQDSGMIFHRRWGDAPLRFLLSYLFWDRTQVMKICSGYIHSMWEPSGSTCSDEMQSPAIQDAVLNQLKGCVPKSTCD